jgi:hypothetical protein
MCIASEKSLVRGGGDADALTSDWHYAAGLADSRQLET